MPVPVNDLDRPLAGVDRDAQLFDPPAQHPTARLVDLHGHQTRARIRRRAFRDRGRGAPWRPRGPASPPPITTPSRACAARASYRGQILDGPIDEAAGCDHFPGSAARRHRSRSPAPADRSRKLPVPAGATDGAARDRCDMARSESVQPDAGSLEETGLDQRQVLGALAGEERRQMHPIVGRRAVPRTAPLHLEWHGSPELLKQSWPTMPLPTTPFS